MTLFVHSCVASRSRSSRLHFTYHSLLWTKISPISLIGNKLRNPGARAYAPMALATATLLPLSCLVRFLAIRACVKELVILCQFTFSCLVHFLAIRAPQFNHYYLPMKFPLSNYLLIQLFSTTCLKKKRFWDRENSFLGLKKLFFFL